MVLTYIHNGLSISHKEQWNSAICSNMDRYREYYALWNKLEKNKDCDITYMCKLKYQMNVYCKEKQIYK